MNNLDLKDMYEIFYKRGFYNSFSIEEDRSDIDSIIDMYGNSWKGKRVLDVGCGVGELAAKIAKKGALVTGVDYSLEAIDKAREAYKSDNLKYVCANYTELPGDDYDVIVMGGVLEHFDKPFEELRFLIERFLDNKGTVLTSSPYFLNPRGYVWMTLALLFDVPMSLSDLHFLQPWQFKEFCDTNGYSLDMRGCQFDWGWGETMIRDYERRLPNALKDAGMDTSGVPRLLDWMKCASNYSHPDGFSGAMMVYRIDC